MENAGTHLRFAAVNVKDVPYGGFAKAMNNAVPGSAFIVQFSYGTKVFFLISRFVEQNGIERLTIMRPDEYGIIRYNSPLIDTNYKGFWTVRVTWMIKQICINAGESATLLNGQTP